MTERRPRTRRRQARRRVRGAWRVVAALPWATVATAALMLALGALVGIGLWTLLDLLPPGMSNPLH